MKPAQILPAAFALIMATLPAAADDEVAPMLAQGCAGATGRPVPVSAVSPIFAAMTVTASSACGKSSAPMRARPP